MKKKGFTLVELLVALMCTTLVFGMVFSTVHFISRVNGDLLEKSSDLYHLSSLDDLVRGKTDDEIRSIIEEKYSDIITSYNLDEVNGVTVFTYTYDGKDYSFVVDTGSADAQ